MVDQDLEVSDVTWLLYKRLFTHSELIPNSTLLNFEHSQAAEGNPT